MRYPYKSSKSAFNSAIYRGKNILLDNLGLKNLIRLRKMTFSSLAGNNSLKKRMKQGKLDPRTRKLHNEIIKRQFKDNNSIDKKDPDLYIFGGLPASRKTSLLSKKVPEKTIMIDSDAYKLRLAKRSKSPLKKYILAHASHLHEEADLLVKKAIEKSIKEHRDVTFDATFKSYDKGGNLIKKFREAGYDVHYLGTQKSPSKTLVHSAKRFIISGRYVPLEYIKEHGNKISENSWKARKLGDTYQIYDTNTLKSKIIAKSRANIRKNFRSP